MDKVAMTSLAEFACNCPHDMAEAMGGFVQKMKKMGKGKASREYYEQEFDRFLNSTPE